MDNPRLLDAVALLKQCKAQGKTYYEATELLTQQGYTQAEIDQASYQFPYTAAAPQTNTSAALDTPPLQPYMVDDEAVKLKKAKQRMVNDSWYRLLPIIGPIFRLKWFGDFATYESLKTGHRKSTVLALWLAVMIVIMVFEFFTPTWVDRVSFLARSTWGLYVAHYVGVILAFALLLMIFRARRR